MGIRTANRTNPMTNESQHIKPSTIVFQCTREEKAKFVRASMPGKLTDWILKTLNREANREQSK
jgi:hypothetical protein